MNKGAIICLQKYSTEYWNYPSDSDNGPVCLGYFNRIEVRKIDTFRKYVHDASKHQADRACSRKQLLLRGRDGLHEEIEIRDPKSENDGRLPFCSKNPTEEYSLGCCSVFNVRDGECRKISIKDDNCITRKDLAEELYKQIKAIQHNGNFRFAIMESLGAEDLCLIVLTNHYDHISNVIKVVQSFACSRGPEKDKCNSCIIDNGHSVLMIDRNQQLEADMWGVTQASIHFSLRSVAGLHYLRTVERTLNTSGILRDGEKVTLDGCSGEYDAVMRCPARLVTERLFGDNGYFASGNNEYQHSVYQSETFLCPIGMNDAPKGPVLPLPPEDSALRKELTSVVENAVMELRTLFHYADDDPDFDYIELPLWRLLKDYWSFASFPLNKELKADLKIQLIASVNAIVEAARKYTPERKTDQFLESYDKIVDALRASMQAGSQQDRWYFGEQKSYIQNVESYYKIMHGYYGMIKDMINLIYHIGRCEGEDQPLLIPLLSFGVKTIIKSDCFSCTVYGKPARLVCIRLPYQALANLPRYLGPLAHELFHYSAPAKRRVRNELMVKALIRVAVTEFLSILTKTQESIETKDYSKQFFYGSNSFRGIFDLDAMIEYVFYDIERSIKKHGKEISTIKLKEIQDFILPKCLYYPISRADEEANAFYFQLWRNLRNIVQQYIDSPEEDRRDLTEHDIWNNIFALYPEQKFADCDTLKRYYRDITCKIPLKNIRKFRKLLYNTFKAMEECPADIFDLEVVMAERNSAQKIKQYLWQINGARRDATLVRSLGKDKLDEWPQTGQKSALLSNHIRIGMILDYYMASQNEHSLSEILADWAPETGSYRVSLGRVRQGFIRDYQDVMCRFEGLLTESREICHDIAVRIRQLMEDETCGCIMKRLTEIYEQYYKLLDQRQRSSKEDAEDHYQKHLFDLCCNLIDVYQTQSPLDINSKTSLPLDFERYTLHNGREHLECVVYSSEDLSICLTTAFNLLKVRHKIPHLWFRGDSRTCQNNLPDMMCSMCAESQPYSVLRFSEKLHLEIVHATKDWSDKNGILPDEDAEIKVLNPYLFNLAMDLLEDAQDAPLNLQKYFQSELVPQCSELSFDKICKESYRYPRAVILDHNEDSYCGLVCYSSTIYAEKANFLLHLEMLQQEYQDKYRVLQSDPERGYYLQNHPCIPFLFRMKLNHLQHVDFVAFLKAMGLRH